MKAKPHQRSPERWHFHPSPVCNGSNLTLVFSVPAPEKATPSVGSQDEVPGQCLSTASVKLRRKERRKQPPIEPHLRAKANLSVNGPLGIKKCVNSAICRILRSRLFST